MTAPNDNVPAASFPRRRAVAGLPVDRDQARPPSVAGPALFWNERKSNLLHASIQTYCRDNAPTVGAAPGAPAPPERNCSGRVEDLSWIEDVVGIERLLDRAMHLHDGRR